MTLIDNLTAFAYQQTTIVLADGSSAVLELRYSGAAQRWFLNVTYGAEVHYGIGLCCHPNILRQWKNVIPFGISCVTTDQTDPFNPNDFATGRVSLYLLDAADVQQVESLIFGAVA